MLLVLQFNLPTSLRVGKVALSSLVPNRDQGSLPWHALPSLDEQNLMMDQMVLEIHQQVNLLWAPPTIQQAF